MNITSTNSNNYYDYYDDSTTAMSTDWLNSSTNIRAYCDMFNTINMKSEYERIINGKPGYVLWGIIFVLLTLFGNICNIVTIIVLKREPIVSTLTILLIGLAISDILAPQANAILAFLHYHLSSHYSNSILFLRIHNYTRFLLQPLSTMFTMSSSWIITATTLFRLVAVMKPFKARQLINKKFAIMSLLLIYFMSFMLILPMYGLLRLRTNTPCFNFTHFELESKSYILNTVYIPLLQILCFYLPWLTSLTLWFFLIRSLRKAERNFSVTFSPKESLVLDGSNHHNHQHQYNNHHQHNFSFSKHKNSSVCSTIIDRTNSLSVTSCKRNFKKRNSQRSSCSCSTTTDNTVASTATTCTSPFCTNQNSLKNYKNSVTTTTTTTTTNGSYTLRLNKQLSNPDSRVSSNINRLRSYNRITLMIVVLCFINLICQLFTFISIFELIYDKIQFKQYTIENEKLNSNNNQNKNRSINETTTVILNIMNVRQRFPIFLSYSLLLNNIFLGINHSCNIFIYTFTNPRFKRNLSNLFKPILFKICSKVLHLHNSTTQDDPRYFQYSNKENNSNYNNNNKNNNNNINNNHNNSINNKKKTNFKHFSSFSVNGYSAYNNNNHNGGNNINNNNNNNPNTHQNIVYQKPTYAYYGDGDGSRDDNILLINQNKRRNLSYNNTEL